MFACFSRGADNLLTISARDPATAAPAAGNGISDLPIISADGRYVVFASTSGNLLSSANTGPVSALAPRSFQVFVRDRLYGTTTLVSVNLSGLPANADCFPAGISTNGQYVLFESAASDLVYDDSNGQPDVFLRDLVHQKTLLVSVNTNGFPGNETSHDSVMTPDARYIAFSSAASDLVVSDTNSIPDVFVRDRLSGMTTLVSAGARSTGSIFLPSLSGSPDITPDGRFVSFYTSATNLLPGLTVAGQVFVRDMSAGITSWASTNAQDLFQSVFGATSEISCNERLSADGKYVIFEACKNPVVATAIPDSSGLILRYDLQTGATDMVSSNATVPAIQFEDSNTLDITPDGRFIAFVTATNVGAPANCINLWDAQSATTSLISQNLNGGVSASDVSLWPRLDSTGRFVTFISDASNLTTNFAAGYNCYLRDTQAAATTLLNAGTNGIGSGGAGYLTPPSICSDGRLVAYVCDDGGIVAKDDNGATDIFVRDDAADTSQLISAHAPGREDISTGFSSGFSSLGISSNGLFVTFTSEGGLVSTDTNNLRDVYLRDVKNATNILISVNTNGIAANGVSSEPSVDRSGRYVVFSSSASDLIPGDTNNSLDIFLRDTIAGTTTLVSRNLGNLGVGNGDSYAPLLSSDARYVLFYSWANNLAAGTFSLNNLFLRDLQKETNYALTTAGVATAAMTPDGHRVAFVDNSGSLLNVWDVPTAQRIFMSSVSAYPLVYPTLSPDGNLVAWVDGRLKVQNLALHSLTMPSPGSASKLFGAQFSNDDRFFVYAINVTNALDANAATDIYLYDFLSGSNSLISQNYHSGMAPNGASDSPVISPDGRFVAYRSFASDNVMTDANEAPDLMLYDRSNALTLLVTGSIAGNRTANNRSTAPTFSADGRNLLFSSWATDLRSQDFNPGNDVFLLPLPGSVLAGSANTNGGTAGSPVVGLQIFQSPGANISVPAISWPTQSGALYRVQFKDDLGAPFWHDLAGRITIEGDFGQAYDLNPSASNRFYRVILGN